MVVLSSGGTSRRLTWPYELVDTTLYGDDRDYQVAKFPILNQKGELAQSSDITVSVGMPIVSGTTKILSYGTSSTILSSMGTDWTGVQDGDILILQVENYLDNTLIYAISSVDALAGTITVPSVIPQMQATFSYRIVRFTTVSDAVEDVRPLLGHVRVNFLPPAGSIVRFNYYYTSYRRNYLMVPDEEEQPDPFWSYGGTQYTYDTYYGAYDRYTMLSDGGDRSSPRDSFWPWSKLKKIGYRYRAFTLSNTPTFNSETLSLNESEKQGLRASLGQYGSKLNEFDLMFSPEFLTDTDKNVILNDKYLQKNLPAVTELQPGVPPFVKTHTDDGHYKLSYHADETDTYDANLEGGQDLAGSFTIIDPDNSGIIDYNNVCEFEDKKNIQLYADLKLVEQDNGGYDATLSSICDAGEAIPFRTTMIEQYYPNRELRLTDYLDFINQVPTEYKTGSIKVLVESAIVKSRTTNFLALRVGDTFTVKDVPFQEDGSTVYKDLEYVLVEVIDVQTGKFHKPFEGPSGEYNFDLVRMSTLAVDVMLNEVNRALILNGKIGYTYGIPESVLQHFPGYGDTGTNYVLNFPDPDPDPYPRNPDNPWISNPTGIETYPITPFVIDGNTTQTNRTIGFTGLVSTSQIIDADGNSYGYTGYATGLTGPSGALDLGITGPVTDVNPRIQTDDDIYQVPAGSTGIYTSYSEAEYRVQWRNWDQDLMIVTFSVGETGVIVEDPFTLLDDVGEGIKRYYWNVSTGSIEEKLFHGAVLETSEEVIASVAAASYPNGLILLTQDQVDALNAGTNPATYNLTDANYQLNRRIVRELLQDNSVRITEIQEFIAL
ncbi:MAG: hypothetical protein GF334_00075 [Candidatus Altiarchaeales archaeon]|nr:hypothetical protein [Candidatus Altiarchaeales archaeon]